MSADLRSGNRNAPQSLNGYLYAADDPVNHLDPLGLTSVFITFTTCARRFIRQEFDDGHDETITGDWVCNTSSISLDFGPAVPFGPDGDASDRHRRLKAEALRALLTNPECASLFGGLIDDDIRLPPSQPTED
jgi:hypothetical protein